MALRRLFCFDRLPKGVLPADQIIGTENNGNGLTYMAGILANPAPANDVYITEQGWVQNILNGKSANHHLRIPLSTWPTGTTFTRYVGFRAKAIGSIPSATANFLSFVDGTTTTLAILTINQIRPYLATPGAEVHIELEITFDGAGKCTVNTFANGLQFATASVTNANLSAAFAGTREAFLRMLVRETGTTWATNGFSFRDIVLYDSISEGPGSLVERTGPYRVKPVYFDAVSGNGWDSTRGSLVDVVNSDINPDPDSRNYIYNDSSESPLTLSIRADLADDLTIFGLAVDATLNTEAGNLLTYGISLNDAGGTESVYNSGPVSQPVWGVQAAPLDTDTSGNRWTIPTLNDASLTLTVKSN